MLRPLLLEERKISEVCGAEGIHQTMLYNCQKKFF